MQHGTGRAGDVKYCTGSGASPGKERAGDDGVQQNERDAQHAVATKRGEETLEVR